MVIGWTRHCTDSRCLARSLETIHYGRRPVCHLRHAQSYVVIVKFLRSLVLVYAPATVPQATCGLPCDKVSWTTIEYSP